MSDLRDNITSQILQTPRHNIIVEIGTGVGKSRLAILKLQQIHKPSSRFLIVVPRNVLIANWKAEFAKWKADSLLPSVTFSTYVSLPKHAGKWDAVVYDEAHHLSERCQESLPEFTIDYSVYLSATLKRDTIAFLYSHHGRNTIEHIKVSTKKAIDSGVLPDPKILLIPLELDTKTPNCLWFPKKPWRKLRPPKLIFYNYKDKWKIKDKKSPYALKCTERQYYNEMSGLIEWYKRKNYHPTMKNMWLHKCGERLEWLANIKIGVVRDILKLTKSNRSITFCANILSSECLSIPCVNSKTGTYNLSKFNEGKIGQIACVDMLDEGCNLYDCQIGIFNMLNSSSRLQCQKIGRILRHKKPIIIMPYFKNTRDEEIVNTIKQDYQGLIFTLTNVNQIKNYL